MDRQVRRQVSNIETRILDGSFEIVRVDSNDMQHILTYTKTDNGIVSIIAKHPSRRIFSELLDTEAESMDSLNSTLENVANWKEPSQSLAHATSHTRSIRAHKHINNDGTLSRKTILVVEDNNGNVAVGRNVVRMKQISMGTMFPLYGRILNYKQYKKETSSSTSDDKKGVASALTKELMRRRKHQTQYRGKRDANKYFWCNPLDCPTKEKGQWWTVHSDPRTLYLQLLDAGSALSATKFWLPESFIQSYKNKCRSERERLTERRMTSIFDKHDYTYDPTKLDVDKLKHVLDSRSSLKKLLIHAHASATDSTTLKRIQILSRELRFEHRRFLRYHLNRIMRSSRLTFDSEDPNSVVVTELHNLSDGHQLRAFVLLLRDVHPSETLRVAPFN